MDRLSLSKRSNVYLDCGQFGMIFMIDRSCQGRVTSWILGQRETMRGWRKAVLKITHLKLKATFTWGILSMETRNLPCTLRARQEGWDCIRWNRGSSTLETTSLWIWNVSTSERQFTGYTYDGKTHRRGSRVPRLRSRHVDHLHVVGQGTRVGGYKWCAKEKTDRGGQWSGRGRHDTLDVWWIQLVQKPKTFFGLTRSCSDSNMAQRRPKEMRVQSKNLPSILEGFSWAFIMPWPYRSKHRRRRTADHCEVFSVSWELLGRKEKNKTRVMTSAGLDSLGHSVGEVFGSYRLSRSVAVKQTLIMFVCSTWVSTNAMVSTKLINVLVIGRWWKLEAHCAVLTCGTILPSR